MNLPLRLNGKKVGAIRMMRGQRALVNDQFGLKTSTWIEVFNCPMAFSIAVLATAKRFSVHFIVARDNHGHVWHTTYERMMLDGRQHKLHPDVEVQMFLSVEYWTNEPWADLGLGKYEQPEPVLELKA